MTTQEQIAQWKTQHPQEKPEAPTSEQEIDAFRAEGSAGKLGATRRRDITLKVSNKGAVSVYGLQRWPVTLYASQMTSLLSNAPKILRFIEENQDKLATKQGHSLH